MRKELDEMLCEKYPLIFKDRHAPMQETAMCWGFSCGDGWYHIIDTLCALMTSEYRQAKERYEDLTEMGVGAALWGNKTVTQEDIDEAKAKMDAAAENVPVAMQVKEKFGGLRFYVHGGTEEHYNYINFAESMSYRTCEVCGAPGHVYTDGWHRTLCDVHAKEENRELEEQDESCD